ncbi:MAG: hydrolase [Verrucomicrobia bacterium RIFCSPLOWO2_12_FULL_64_8]|nr:MAG: hydrolase [Verrucomicrobia bacterium RIFCSPLOWO2_12_FULL_64_8]
MAKTAARKLVLWDIDGTLIVSHGAGVRAMERALREQFGVSGSFEQIDWAGRTDSWIAHEALSRHGLADTPENVRDYLEAYLRILPLELQARQGWTLPGIIELLEIIHRREDLAQGLLTGNLARGAQLKLSHYRVWHYFEFGAFADDSPRRNDLGPHALRRARESHRVEFPPDRTFIVGDTPHDIECGRVIGAHTIAVATGRHSADELRAHRPTAVFSDFHDTAAVLRLIDAG